MENNAKSYQLIPKLKEKKGKRCPFRDNDRGEYGFGRNDRGFYDYGFRMPIKEFELIGMPPSVKEFFDLFQSDEHIPIIWIDDDGFVYGSRYTVDSWIQELFQERPLFTLYWAANNKNRDRGQGLCFYSSTGQNALSCWDDLFDLSMKGFSSSHLSSARPWEPKSCPLSCEILEKFMVQNQKGRCCFWGMIFTPSQCRTLATSGNKTHLDFSDCRFQDDGLAFVDAYLLPENQDFGPAKLTIDSYSPFGDHMLISCLNQLQELTLSSLRNLSSELLQTVVSTDLDYLGLRDVKHDDEEVVQILISNIREGHGPKGIYVDSIFLGSNEDWLDFFNALAHINGHKYLKTLTLYGDCNGTQLGPEAEHAFLAAWSNDLGLTSFALRCFDITETFWNSFLTKLSLQTSLRKLEFYGLDILDSTATDKERTEQFCNVILANGHIEQMEFCSSCFDEEEWQKRVIPALQHNEHRERFTAVETIGDGHRRTAILAEALITVSDRPSLFYAVLHRNVDVVGELGQ